MTSPYTGQDPFTLVMAALWNLLETETRFTELVPSGNRIKLASDRIKPEKTEYSTKDFPEVTIAPAGNQYQSPSSSSSVTVVQRFQIQIYVADKRIHKQLFPLKWIVFMILASLDGNLDIAWVRNAVLNDVTDQTNNEKHPGWNCYFDVDVTMVFDRASMKALT